MHRSPENHGYLNKLTLLRLLLARVRPECTITVAHSPLHVFIIARRPPTPHIRCRQKAAGYSEIETDSRFAVEFTGENGITSTHYLQSIADGAHDEID